MNYIVGLLGYSRAGKDEAGKAFLNEGFKRYAFGDEVKIELAEHLNIPVEYLHDHKTKEKYRSDMVAYGEGKRKENPNYWIDRLRDKILTDIDEGRNVVITDIRRVSEINFITYLKVLSKSTNGEPFKVVLVHVDRPEAALVDDDAASHYAINYAKAHNRIDFTIENKYDAYILNAIVKHEIKNKIYAD